MKSHFYESIIYRVNISCSLIKTKFAAQNVTLALLNNLFDNVLVNFFDSKRNKGCSLYHMKHNGTIV
jgi:hypothetical protein